MAWEWIGQLAPAVATLGAAVFGLARGQGKLRSNIRHDVETLKLLPETSTGYTALLEHIAWQASRLHTRESVGRRDWSGFTLGVLLTLGGGYGTVWFLQHDPWWRWFGLLLGLLAALGIYGMVEGLAVVERNSKGVALRQQRSD